MVEAPHNVPDGHAAGVTGGHSARIEQRTLKISLAAVAGVALLSLAWGVAIESDVVILNGVFSMVSLIGSVLYLTAARLVARPADRRFQYGYAHVEPLVTGANGLLVLVICVYAFINGVEGVRAGGGTVNAAGVVWFGAVTGAICLAVGTYELWVLEEPWRGLWARYADSALVAVLALLFMPVPLGVLRQTMRELLHTADADRDLAERVEAVLRRVAAEHDVASHTTHVAKVGRASFIEANIVAGPRFALQTVATQDALRERIWSELGLEPDRAWLSIIVTGDPRWA